MAWKKTQGLLNMHQICTSFIGVQALNYQKIFMLFLLMTLSFVFCGCSSKWVYSYDARVIVTVEPVDHSAESDEAPARIHINFKDVLEKAGIAEMADINSIKVTQFEKQTGKQNIYKNYAYAEKEYDIPFRWYDDEIPYDFPEYERDLSSSNGVYDKWTIRRRWGYFYDCIGSWRTGNLVWLHQQKKKEKAYYSVYFNFLKKGQKAYCVPPRGFVGDGLNRCVKSTSGTTTGLIHSRIDLDDYNGDGLTDIIVGCSRGGIIWYPNLGSASKPKFKYSKMIFTTDGIPMDAGWCSTPRVFDFNGDGKKDLVIGLEWNRIGFFENIGTNANRKYTYKGLVKDENGRDIVLPYSPCPEGLLADGTQIYKRDYFPVIDIADIDGDGRNDLLAGGYVTGMIFHYKNTGKNTDGTPKYKYIGPIQADGNDLDVGWNAAPCFYDFDSDGKLDLVVGNMKMSAGGGDSASSEHFLHYYKNTGSAAAYIYTEKAFPRVNEFPSAALTTPRAADLNNDGLTDLVVSYGNKISIYYNQGSATKPLFSAHSNVISIPWANDSLSAYQFMDYNGDGLKDAVKGWHVGLNNGKGNPWEFGTSFYIPKEQAIELHLSGIGDDWQFPRIYDLDSDGDIDLMNADHSGYIWFHENNGTNKEPNFDANGVKLMQTNGKYVQVGPAAATDDTPAFDKLQGARTSYTVADFDKDGFNDLVTGDTFGYIRYFRNAGQQNAIRFESAVEIGKLSSRLVPCAADWNNDGWQDVVTTSSSTEAYVLLNAAQRSSSGQQFMPKQPIKISGAPYGAGAPLAVTDLNDDGDSDLILYTAYGYCCWFENTFIKHGYAEGNIVKVERRPGRPFEFQRSK